MKIRRIFTIIAITFALLFPNGGLVYAMPPLPSSFYGTVKSGAVNMPVGTTVSASINGVQYASTTTIEYGGDTVYSLNIAGDDSYTTGTIEGGKDGDTIQFYIGGKAAQQTATWVEGGNAVLNLTLEANQAPVITQGESINVTISEDGTPLAFNLTLTATDANASDSLTWSLSSPASHGTATASGTGASPVVVYTPAANYASTDSFAVQVSDGNGGTDTITVNVTMTPVNDAPVIAGQAVLSTAEDTALTVLLSDLTFTDVDNTTGFSVSLQDGSNYVVSGTTITPAKDFSGILTVPASVSDGQASSNVYNLTVTVTPVNDAPVITEGESTIVTMSEDGVPTAFSLTLHATDADGNTLTWNISTPAVKGAASVTGTGNTKAIVYSPNSNSSGPDSFVVQVVDGNGGTDTITVNVTVNPVNDPPVITGQAVLSTAEDTALTITLSNLTVTDVDNTYPAGFSLNLQGGSNYTVSGTTITPAKDYNGPLTVPVTVNDGADNSNVYNLAVTVTAVNDAPVCSAVTLTTAKNTAGDTAPNCTDVDSASLTYSIASQGGGTASVVSGILHYVPATDYVGSDLFTYQASDGTVLSNAANVSVTVTPTNDAPVIAEGTSTAVTMSEDGSPTAFSLTLHATDTNGDSLTWSVTTPAANGTASASGTGNSQVVSYSPDGNYYGADSFVVQVSDGKLSDTILVNVTINPQNDAPVITGQTALSTLEETALTITLSNLTVTDVDNTYPTGFSLTVQDGTNYTHVGNIITPVANFNGTLTVPVTVNDGTASSNIYNLAVTVNPVNDVPVITGQKPLSTPEDVALTLTLSDLTILDPDNTVFTLTVSNGSNYTVSGTTITPAANYYGTLTVPITVNDGTNESAPYSLTVSVVSVNDAPVITGQAALTTAEDTVLTIALNDLTVSDVDNIYPTGFSLVVQDGTNYSHVGNVITPAADFNGTLTVPVTVNDGADSSNVYNLEVTVTPVNDAPVCSAVTLTTAKNTAGDTAPNCTDVDSGSLTYSLASQSDHGTASVLSGLLHYVPGTDYVGTDLFTYQASDGTLTSSPANVTVTVNGTNTAPVITEGASTMVTMSEDGSPTAFSLTLHATDVDAGDTLTWSISTAAFHGTASASGTGNSKVIGYVPTGEYNGTDGFVVMVSDGHLSDTISVSVRINAVNDAPVITEGASTTTVMSEDGSPTAFSLTLHGTDVEGDTLTWSISTAASHGTATAGGMGSSKVINYNPASNFYGSDSFGVSVSDGNGGMDTITVNVTVSPVNDTPVAANDTYSAQKNTVLIVTATDGVLKNDSDVDGNSLNVIVQTSSTHGTLTMNKDGSFTYTPEKDYTGGDSFTYRVFDGTAYSNTATVNIVFVSIPITGIDGIFFPLVIRK